MKEDFESELLELLIEYKNCFPQDFSKEIVEEVFKQCLSYEDIYE